MIWRDRVAFHILALALSLSLTLCEFLSASLFVFAPMEINLI